MSRKSQVRLPREMRLLRQRLEDIEVSVSHCHRELDTQFKRMAQMQMELDEIRRAVNRLAPRPRVRHK
jgi:hypothetical protein